MRFDEFLSIVVVIMFFIAAILIAKKFSKKPHKALTNLVVANIILDFVAIAIWGVFPATQWSIYNLDFFIVGIEAAVAVVIFTFILFGLIKTKKWAPFLAIALTITQRVFTNYVFFLSIGNLITLIWSLLIIYFAYLEIKNKQ